MNLFGVRSDWCTFSMEISNFLNSYRYLVGFRIKKISKPYLSRFRGQVVRRSGAPKAPRRLNRRPKPNAGVVAIATDDDVRDVHVVHDEQRDQPVLQLDSSFTDSSSSEGDDGEIAGGPVLGTYKTNRESHVSHFEDVATHV